MFGQKQVILKLVFVFGLRRAYKIPDFKIYFKNTNKGMSSQWENQQWDVIRVISGLFPIILGEKVVFSPYEKW